MTSIPTLPNEIWKALPQVDIFKYLEPNKYFVSTLGRVYSAETKRILSYNYKHSYNYVNLNNKYNNYRTACNIGKMVLLTFDYRDDYDKLTVFYINGNSTDNRLYNLAWSDYKINGNYLMLLPVNHSISEIPTEDGEIWAPIFSVGALSNLYTYEIYASTHGRIYNFNYQNKRNNPNFITLYRDPNGYLYAGMYKYDENNNLKSVSVGVHRIIANTFLYNENYNKLVINHIDGNPSNNHIENLEWCSQQHNVAEAFNIGLSGFYGDNNDWHQYTTEDIYFIYELYLNGYSRVKIANQFTLIRNKPIQERYVSDLCSGSVRTFDLSNYLISKGYTCSNIFSKEQIAQIMELAVKYPKLKDFYSQLPYINRYTPAHLAAGVIFKSVLTQINYNNYILS